MPIFEYHCLECDKDFEKLVMGTNSQIKCPDCGNMEVEKKFSTFGIKSGATFSSSVASSSCGGCTSSSCSGCH